MPTLAELNTRAERWRAQRQLLVEELQKEAANQEKEKTLLSDTKACIQLLQFISQETTRDREVQAATLATYALRDTFSDIELALNIEHKVYRGHAGVEFKLRDEIKGVEGDPMESFGGGPASLLGLILQVISVVRQPFMDRILLLDEPMTQVSEGYQEAAGRLLRKLCDPPPKGLNFKMLVITHMSSIAAAAHKRYEAQTSDDGQFITIKQA